VDAVAQIRAAFFDSDLVAEKLEAGKRRAFVRLGSYVRTAARSSIKRRKKSSPPGRPPSAHSGEIKLIFFSWDEQTQSMVVGPVIFQGKSGGGIVPKLLEYGGDVARGGEQKHYAGNPFMVPAAHRELPKVKSLFPNLLG
jgi:hypothetical protein